MKSLSVSKLKSTLSEQIREVKRGEAIIVTERGRPVARLVPVEPNPDEDVRLEALERDGVIRRGRGRLPDSFWEEPLEGDSTGSVRAAVDEEREGGW